MRPALMLSLLLLSACNSNAPDERAAAVHAVTTWAPKGIKGQVVLDKVECAPLQGQRGIYRCRGDARGGGQVWMTAKRVGAGFDITKEPILSASLLEALIQDHLDKLGISVLAKCGDRVRPAKAGDKFKCAIEDAAGKVLNAADVTIKDATGAVDWQLVTAPIAPEAIKQKVVEFVATHDISGDVDCGGEHRFSTPGDEFACTVAGDPRKVKVVFTSFRGNMNLELVTPP